MADPHKKPPVLPAIRPADINCIQCGNRLAHIGHGVVHLDVQVPAEGGSIKGLLRADGLTLACPGCGTLNIIKPGRATRGRELIEKDD